MKKWLEELRKKPMYARILTVINLACSAAVFALCVLYLLDFLPNALVIALPLIGVAMMTQCGLFWKKDRGMALLSLAAGFFMFGVTGYIMLK